MPGWPAEGSLWNWWSIAGMSVGWGSVGCAGLSGMVLGACSIAGFANCYIPGSDNLGVSAMRCQGWDAWQGESCYERPAGGHSHHSQSNWQGHSSNKYYSLIILNTFDDRREGWLLALCMLLLWIVSTIQESTADDATATRQV